MLFSDCDDNGRKCVNFSPDTLLWQRGLSPALLANAEWSATGMLKGASYDNSYKRVILHEDGGYFFGLVGNFSGVDSSGAKDNEKPPMLVYANLTLTDEVIRLVLIVVWSTAVLLAMVATVGCSFAGLLWWKPRLSSQHTLTLNDEKSQLSAQLLVSQGFDIVHDMLEDSIRSNTFSLRSRTSGQKHVPLTLFYHDELLQHDSALALRIARPRAFMRTLSLITAPLAAVVLIFALLLSFFLPTLSLVIPFFYLIMIQAWIGYAASRCIHRLLVSALLGFSLLLLVITLVLPVVVPLGAAIHLCSQDCSAVFSSPSFPDLVLLVVVWCLGLALCFILVALEVWWVLECFWYLDIVIQVRQSAERVHPRLLTVLRKGFKADESALSDSGTSKVAWENLLHQRRGLARTAWLLALLCMLQSLLLPLFPPLLLPCCITALASHHIMWASFSGKDGDCNYNRAFMWGILSAMTQIVILLVMLILCVAGTVGLIRSSALFFMALPWVMVSLLISIPLSSAISALSLLVLRASSGQDVIDAEKKWIDGSALRLNHLSQPWQLAEIVH